MISAVDTSVLLDVFLPDDRHGEKSKEWLRTAYDAGAIIVCDIVYAELAPAFGDRATLDGALRQINAATSPINATIAYDAGAALDALPQSRGPEGANHLGLPDRCARRRRRGCVSHPGSRLLFDLFPGIAEDLKGRTTMQLLHTMLRVGDLQRSIDFYTNVIGMDLLRTTERPSQKYTLAFVAFNGGNKNGEAELELTYNYGVSEYDLGSAYGHIALGSGERFRHLRANPRRGRQHHARTGPGEGRGYHHRVRRGPRRLQGRTDRNQLARNLNASTRRAGRSADPVPPRPNARTR